MKLIQAVIRPSALTAVRAALTAAGIGGISVAEASSCVTPDALVRGEQAQIHRERCAMDMQMEIAVTDVQLASALEAISSALPEGSWGEGEIHVVRLTQARRIRTGEINDKAL